MRTIAWYGSGSAGGRLVRRPVGDRDGQVVAGQGDVPDGREQGLLVARRR